MADQQHSYTGILLIIFAIAILLSAIFFTVAQVRVTETNEYKAGTNTKIQGAKNNLLAAYILGYIAAGISIVLAILYFGHVAWGIKSEVPHAILFILLFLLVVVSGILGFVALSDIDNAKVTDNKGAPGWIWAAEIAALVGLIFLIISGAWRAQYKSSRPSTTDTSQASTQSELTFTAPTTVYTSPGYSAASAAPSYAAPSYMAPDASQAGQV